MMEMADGVSGEAKSISFEGEKKEHLRLIASLSSFKSLLFELMKAREL